MNQLPLCYLLLAALPVVGQVHEHADLSRTLLFKTELTRIKRDSVRDSCRVRVVVVNKRNGRPVFTTAITPDFLFAKAYTKQHAVRSYLTGVGRSRAVSDYDYGDLVVADFNFDGREDFAAKNDSGGNRGPLYSYFIQNGAGSFVLDKFLTEQLSFFPDRMDKATKTLALESDKFHYHYQTTLKLDAKTGKWRKNQRSWKIRY